MTTLKCDQSIHRSGVRNFQNTFYREKEDFCTLEMHNWCMIYKLNCNFVIIFKGLDTHSILFNKVHCYCTNLTIIIHQLLTSIGTIYILYLCCHPSVEQCVFCRGRGAVVNVSAGGSCMPVPQMTVYSATKVTLLSYTTK